MKFKKISKDEVIFNDKVLKIIKGNSCKECFFYSSCKNECLDSVIMELVRMELMYCSFIFIDNTRNFKLLNFNDNNE